MRFPYLLLLTACDPEQINGSVIDGSGQPIDGVSVSIEGTSFETTTNNNGSFSLDFTPGEKSITIHHPNFFDRVLTIDLTDSKSKTLKPTVLVKNPTEDGLFVLHNDALMSLGEGILMRDTQRLGPAKKRRFCLDKEKSKPNAVPAGSTRLADKNARPWRLFKLDGDGCAYRDAKDARGRWVVEYRERPTLGQQRRDDGIALHDVTLGKGEYFIADWAGFFVPEPENEGRYSGRWIRVED